MALCNVLSLLRLNVFDLYTLHGCTSDREQDEDVIVIQLRKEDVCLRPRRRSNDRRGYVQLHNQQAFVGSIDHWKRQCTGIVLRPRRHEEHHGWCKKNQQGLAQSPAATTKQQQQDH
uniref:RxLR effector candidate protein n=1 Tax=Hyaloperonospora arabidopsidis (strain Emoy2) TaxID=559515 RepID=M4B8S8_HYAAE